MKSIRLFSMAVLSMAMVLVSCSGEDGEQGPEGKPGIDGVNGQDGKDGNANVQELTFNLEEFNSYTELVLDLNSIVDIPENYAYLFYIEHNASGHRYSIPGHLEGNTHYASVYTDLQNGELVIKFYDLNDAPIDVPGGEYSQVIVVAAELTNTSKNSENLMAELKAAGVDTSDYNAVAEYFGLE